MNAPRKISRRLDAARDGKYHVAEMSDKELAEIYANRPVLLRASAHVESKKKEANRGKV